MNPALHRYFILNKPYNMVSQFVSSHLVNLLGDIDFDFPEGTHAIGRLDNLSEGLLILTTNRKVTKLLFEGDTPHKRTYLVLVKNKVSEEALQQLKEGVIIKIADNKDYLAIPLEVSLIENPEIEFSTPYILHPYAQYSWLRITLTEGKYHQVRKMVFALRHPCKRLIRVSIEDLSLGDLQPGKIREIDENDFFEKLRITNWR